jgi:hypothetical protein
MEKTFKLKIIKSDSLIITNYKKKYKINLFCQFFISDNLKRHNEILFVLKKMLKINLLIIYI